jgi:hypothetical protein
MPQILEIRPYTEGKRKNDNLVARVQQRPMQTETFNRLAMLPGFKKWDGLSAIIFRPVLSNIKFLAENFPESLWMDGTDEFMGQLRKLEADAAKVIQFKNGPLPPIKAGGYQYKRLPRNHQRRALLASWDKEMFALLMEQRTGKTKVAIDNAAYLWQLKKVNTLVIVTLNGVHRNWVDFEIPEDLPDWVPRETFFMRPNHTKRYQDQFEKALYLKDGLRIFSFNVEALSRDGIARDLFKTAIGDGSGVFTAVDESSDCIKTYDAARTKHILKVASRSAYRRILTGTQSPEGRPDELFSQYLFLSESILGYDTITTFRAEFCEQRSKYSRTVVVPGCKNPEKLRALIDGHSFRVRRADCMDLPKKIYKRWPVSMEPEQKRIYNELKQEFTVDYKGKTLTAAMAMTRVMRLMQITSGWFPMDEEEMVGKDADGMETWRKIRPIEGKNPKLIALDDILRTNDDEKVIIWARFRPDLELIQKHLGESFVSVHGGIKEEQKVKNKRAFKESKAIRGLIANPAGGVARGHNFTFATLAVYFSNSLRLIDRTQSEDRTEGDESRRDSTLVVDIEMVGTQDSKNSKRLRAKKDWTDIINGDPRSIFMEEDEE